MLLSKGEARSFTKNEENGPTGRGDGREGKVCTNRVRNRDLVGTRKAGPMTSSHLGDSTTEATDLAESRTQRTAAW